MNPSSSSPQKWKRLSRLQRSLILFIVIFLLICGISSFPTINQRLTGKLDLCKKGLSNDDKRDGILTSRTAGFGSL